MINIALSRNDGLSFDLGSLHIVSKCKREDCMLIKIDSKLWRVVNWDTISGNFRFVVSLCYSLCSVYK